MDPDENLKEQRRIAKSVLDCEGDCDSGDLVRLCELVQALDEWISKGGFLPKRWAR